MIALICASSLWHRTCLFGKCCSGICSGISVELWGNLSLLLLFPKAEFFERILTFLDNVQNIPVLPWLGFELTSLQLQVHFCNQLTMVFWINNNNINVAKRWRKNRKKNIITIYKLIVVDTDDSKTLYLHM